MMTLALSFPLQQRESSSKLGKTFAYFRSIGFLHKLALLLFLEIAIVAGKISIIVHSQPSLKTIEILWESKKKKTIDLQTFLPFSAQWPLL